MPKTKKRPLKRGAASTPPATPVVAEPEPAEAKPEQPTGEPVAIGSIRLGIDALKQVVAGLEPVFPKGASLPVVAHVAFGSENGHITARMNGLNAFAVCTIAEASVPASELAKRLLEARYARENGVFLVPFEELRNLVRTADRKSFISMKAFRHDPQRYLMVSYTVAGAPITRRVETLDIGEFPPFLEEIPMTEAVDVDAKLREAILKAFSVSSEDVTRYVLQGVAFDASVEDHHCIVATDGRRIYSHNSQAFPFNGKTHILPRHPALTRGPVASLPWRVGFDEGTEKTGRHARVIAGPWNIIFQGIDGNYPNWRQAIPNDKKAVVSLSLPKASRDFILASLPKIPLAAKTELLIIEITDKLTCRIADASVVVPGAVPTWKPKAEKSMRIGINREFFLDAIRQGFDTMNAIEPQSAVVFRTGAEIHVAMPVKLG